MPFFTIIAEHRGGTYVGQVNAVDEADAVVVWSRNNHMGRKFAAAFRWGREELGETPIRLSGLKNAWYIGALHDNHLVAVNIVKTVSPRARQSGGRRTSGGRPRKTRTR